jgi:hypothetical protein
MQDLQQEIEEDKAILALLLAKQAAFYDKHIDHLRFLHEERGQLIIHRVTVGDAGVYAGQVEIGGCLFALLENDIGTFHILPIEDCCGARDGRLLRVCLAKDLWPRLITISDMPLLESPTASVLMAEPILRSHRDKVGDLITEQKAFYMQYQIEFTALQKEKNLSILLPVTPGCFGVYAGQVELGARLFALLKHSSGAHYILPTQNCHSTRIGQKLRVMLYQNSGVYWLIAVTDSLLEEETSFGLELGTITQSLEKEQDHIKEVIEKDRDADDDIHAQKTVSPKEKASDKELTLEKSRDFEMEM